MDSFSESCWASRLWEIQNSNRQQIVFVANPVKWNKIPELLANSPPQSLQDTDFDNVISVFSELTDYEREMVLRWNKFYRGVCEC